MLIIGVDFHTRFQQIAMVDTETGDLVERRLDHRNGEAQEFYAGLQKAVCVGMEATGYAQWFERMLARLGTSFGSGMQRGFAQRWCESRRPMCRMLCIFSSYCCRSDSRGSGFPRRRNGISDSCCAIVTRWLAYELRFETSCRRWPWARASTEKGSCGRLRDGQNSKVWR